MLKNEIDVYCTCLRFQCSDLCSSSFKLSPLEIASIPKATITHPCISDSIADPIPFLRPYPIFSE